MIKVAKSHKIAIFGAGGTGGSVAELLVRNRYREVALVDIQQDLALGKAMDIEQVGSLAGSDTNVEGGSDPALIQDADIVVITAGIGRKPGLNREDLLATNGAIMEQFSEAIKTYASDAYVIVLTNPADILARIVLRATGFASHRVMAQGGILDSARLTHWLSKFSGISQRHIRSMVLGGHGDHMVPVKRFASIYGVPATDIISEAAWNTAVEHTRFGGGEILAKFKTHGAAVTPGHAVLDMIDALTSATPHLLPVSVQSQGAYGLPNDVFIGLPVKLSQSGVEEILELPLSEEEHQQLHNSASAMQSAYETWARNQSS